MKSYSLIERARFYHEAFPNWPPLRADERWIDGMWILGNNYRGSGYYGSYPAGYLKRIMVMFPDAERILHLFSGSLPPGNYDRLDINPELKPEICADAEQLSQVVKPGYYDLILADPPYSKEDAKRYGYPLVSRNRVVSEVAKVLRDGGYLIWLDQVLPMFRKTELSFCGAIGVIISTNHRFRVSIWFRKNATNS